MNNTDHFSWNLLAAKRSQKMLRWIWFPLILQVVSLLFMAALAVIGWRLGLHESHEQLLIFRKTNLTTLMVWGLWWPGMIATVFLFGRVWCTICPMELLNRIGDGIARRVGWPRVKLGRLLRAGWFTLLAYLVLQFLVNGMSLHRVPHYTALLLIVLGATALLSGLIIAAPRSFCKAFCPASPLLATYGRFTSLQLDKRVPEVCSGCTTKDCTDQANRYRFDGRSCPSLLRPDARHQSDGCVLCFQCAKVCPHDNIGFGLARAEAGVRNHRLLSPVETGFVMIAAGFVTHEVIGEVKWLEEYFHYIPNVLQQVLASFGFGWLEAAWYLGIFPALLWALVVLFSRITGHRGSLGKLLAAAATGAAPVLAVAHLAKALAKFDSWFGYLPISLADPGGEETFRNLVDGSLTQPSPFFGLSVVGWLMFLMSAIITLRVLRQSGCRFEGEQLPAMRTGLVIIGGLFSSVLWCWLGS